MAQRTLWILTFVNLFNYLDRFVVSALVEPLKRSELGLTDTQIGLLTSAFVYVYSICSPFCGYLGDRVHRPKLIGIGVAIWSAATAMGSIATGFATLFLCRAFVGVGEAAYGTIAPAMLSDLFTPSQRGRIYSIFFMAIPIGSALGFILGGLIAAHYGWRAAFLFAGLPGIFLAYLVYKLPDPVRGGMDDQQTSNPKTRYIDLLKIRPYVFTVLGYAAYTFALGGLAFWLPAFFERVRGLSTSQAATMSGGILVVTGFLGTLIGGRLAHKPVMTTVFSTALSVPFAYIALTNENPSVYWSATFLAELCLFASTSPVNTMLVNFVPANLRAGAVAMSNFTIHVLGDAISPGIIGWTSDRTDLGQAVLIVPLALIVATVLWSFVSTGKVSNSKA